MARSASWRASCTRPNRGRRKAADLWDGYTNILRNKAQYAFYTTLCNEVGVVATLEDHETAILTKMLRHSQEASSHPPEAARGHAAPAQRVALDRIKACRNQNRLWLEALQQGTKQVLQDVLYIEIAIALVERHVQCIATRLRFPSIL